MVIVEDNDAQLSNNIFSKIIDKVLISPENITLLQIYLQKKGKKINEEPILIAKNNFYKKIQKCLKYFFYNGIRHGFVQRVAGEVLINGKKTKIYETVYRIYGIEFDDKKYHQIVDLYKSYRKLKLDKINLYRKSIKFYFMYSFKNKALDLELIFLLKTMLEKEKENLNNMDKILVSYIFFEFLKNDNLS